MYELKVMTENTIYIYINTTSNVKIEELFLLTH